jgi:hypothetical protein
MKIRASARPRGIARSTAIAFTRESADVGFRHAQRVSRNATLAIVLALLFGLTSLAGTAISLAF